MNLNLNVSLKLSILNGKNDYKIVPFDHLKMYYNTIFLISEETSKLSLIHFIEENFSVNSKLKDISIG